MRYWMRRYGIPRRTRSDAVYVRNHPNGDPFTFVGPKTIKDATLFGMGLGLYWGEGTKASKNSVRLGNTDPLLIKKFIEFLLRFFGINRKDLRFALQIFSDMDPEEALAFWQKALRIRKRQFYKTVVTRSGSIGTYRRKSQTGVLTIYYNNKKLRELLGSLMPG
ncbi:MAG: hypothetical protein U0514_02770 [Candidatus Andersenbacteria bacterium]